MSSLLIFPQPDVPALERATKYFRNRPNYTLEGNRIAYDNDETGCFFVIDVSPPGTTDDDGQPSYSIAFDLNYNRPKPFIREAVAEIAAFNKAFPGQFLNEENDELEDFETGRYLASWTRVNDSFIRSRGAEPGQSEAFAPSAMVEQAWAWNAARKAQMAALGNGIFIAKTLWMRTGTSAAVPLIIWSDMVPTLFPAFVERLVIVMPGQKQSFWSFITRSSAPVDIIRVVPVGMVLANSEVPPRTVNGVSAYATESKIPDKLAEAIQSIPQRTQIRNDLIDPSLVLEAEILETEILDAPEWGPDTGDIDSDHD